MQDSPLHPSVSFAVRYGNASSDLLNAHTALYRLTDLVEDATRVRAALEIQTPEESRWAPWFGAEIVSYYAVGFVTCFEWHGRSRTADLFGYAPACLRPEDLKGQLSERAMIQLLSQGASVARMLAASVSVTSFSKYMDRMNRVFGEVGVPFDAYEALTKPEAASGWVGVSGGELEQVQRMFRFRNELAHEVSISIVGHLNIRDSWTPDQAEEVGSIALRIMQRLERVLTAFAPSDFPNLLDDDGYPRSEVERLEQEITRLEGEIQTALIREDQEASVQAASWSKVCSAYQDAYEAQTRFIDRADFLHLRYLDLRTPLKLALTSDRLRFLRLIDAELRSDRFGPGSEEEP